ncbi:MAG: hypothetical protein NTY38_25280, partial [Acidobacteria bacterium]|nr:hypothetical protein [Acidobacteriota bacterium]
PLLRGKDAIRNALKQLLSDPNAMLKFATGSVDIGKGGDLAYGLGTYTMVETDRKSKKPMEEKGKYITIYRKQADGVWKAVADMNNADAPPVPVSK